MKCVLVIEDNLQLLENIVEILEYNGYRTIMANGGSEGIEAAREHLPDIIVSDIMMPEIKGYDVLRELRHDSKTASIPFIFLTSKTDSVDVRMGMELGADDYLTKPFKETELLAAIDMRLKKRAALEMQQQRMLTRKFVRVQENERRDWTRALQDHVGQSLIGLKLSLYNTDQLSPHQLQFKLQEIQALTDQVLTQLNSSINDIWPVILDELGLLPALLHQFEQLFLHTGIRVQFMHNGLETSFSQDVKITVYRVLQEVLSNAARYAQVKELEAAVWVENGVLYLDIQDRGVGFDLDQVMGRGEAGGLIDLNDRITALDGWMTVQTAPTMGVRVMAHFPLQGEDAVLPSGEEPLDIVSPLDARRESPIDAATTTVVIADGNQIIREGLKHLLDAETRIQVTGEANERDHILKMIREVQPDVLILAIAMNGVSNLDLIPLAMTLRPTLRVLVFANQSNELYMYESLRAGASGCILNTIDAADLIRAVHSVAQGGQYWSAPLSEETLKQRFDVYQTESPEAARLGTLTPREQEILKMIAQGSTSKKIASALSISPRTAETHRTNIASKLGVRTQAELIRFALKHGLGT